MTFPQEGCWIVIFENGERWKYNGDTLTHDAALEQAAARSTKIKCFLYGHENYWDEFVPSKAFNANGDPDNGLLLVNLIEGGLNSKNAVVVGMTAYATKKIMQEVKENK